MEKNELYGKRIDYMYFFNESIKLTKFIQDCINSDEYSMVYLMCKKNSIEYGTYGKENNHVIQMISSSDFGTIFRVRTKVKINFHSITSRLCFSVS